VVQDVEELGAELRAQAFGELRVLASDSRGRCSRAVRVSRPRLPTYPPVMLPLALSVEIGAEKAAGLEVLGHFCR